MSNDVGCKIIFIFLSLLQNKVSSVVFKCGPSGDDMVLVRQVDIESRFSGWIHAVLPRKKLFDD